jgi:hypothetical protein
MPIMSLDPGVNQASQQIIQLQQQLTSPTNIANILITNPTSIANIINSTITNPGPGGPAIIGDTKWVQVAVVGTQLKVSHIGPDVMNVNIPALSQFAVTVNAGIHYLSETYSSLDFDSKGHKVAAGASGNYNLALTAISVIVDWQVSGDLLQVKRQTVYVLDSDAAGAWETVHTGTECSGGASYNGGSP